MRVVLDTNIFISMALGGIVSKIDDGWKAEKFTLLVSDEIVSEYLNVLQRPKLHLSASTISAIVNRIYRRAEFVMAIEKITVVKSDPTDNKFLEAAIAGRAEAIVSGDNHLLELKEFRAIPILSAREFLDWLAGQ